jgi:hypothetical protein
MKNEGNNLTKEVKLILNIIVVFALCTVLFFFLKRIKHDQSVVWLMFNINDILFSLSLLIFINLNYKIGMIFSVLTFSIYLIIIILKISDRLLTLSTLFRFSSIVYMIYFVLDTKQNNVPNSKRSNER